MNSCPRTTTSTGRGLCRCRSPLKPPCGSTRDSAAAAALAFNAGFDVELPGHECALHLKEALARGEISEETIDTLINSGEQSVASIGTPLQALRAARRRDSAQVRVRVPVDMLNFTDGRGERIVEPGDFDLMVGGSNRDIHLSDTVSVTGQAVRTLERDWRMVSEVEVLS
jgi:hypothetical protein